MDATELLVLALIGIILGALCFGAMKFIEFRRKYSPTLARLQSLSTPEGLQSVISSSLATLKLEEVIANWLFEETDQVQEVNGVKMKIYQPSPRFRQLVALIIPEVIGQGMAYAKQNIKLSDVIGGGLGGGGALKDLAAGGVDKALKQAGLAKEWRGIAGLAIQYGKPIMEFLGKRGTAARASGSSTAVNPFLPKS